MQIKQDIVGTQCCGTCGHNIEGDLLCCGKANQGQEVSGRLYVDYFYCCPLWRPKRAGLYV